MEEKPLLPVTAKANLSAPTLKQKAEEIRRFKYLMIAHWCKQQKEKVQGKTFMPFPKIPPIQ